MWRRCLKYCRWQKLERCEFAHQSGYWKDLQQELQDIYLSTLEDFNTQLIAQNYFERSDLRNKQ